jgi:hypothetical protein
MKGDTVMPRATVKTRQAALQVKKNLKKSQRKKKTEERPSA